MDIAGESALVRLQNWYLSLCNGDWEHSYGFEICNIDNPGWSFKAELQDTALEDVRLDMVKIQREDEDDWLIYKVEDYEFLAYCGPSNLEEVIIVFLNWAEENSRDVLG